MPQEAFVLMLKTALSGQTVERLIAGVCLSTFQVAFEGIEQTPNGERKVIRISFKIEEDRERFRRELRKLASSAPKEQSKPRA
jgi:hypothetical protein